MKRRPDWVGDREREEALARWRAEDLARRQKRNRERREKHGDKKFWEIMTPEEREALRVELVNACDTVEALVAEMSTPEAIAEAKRLKEERDEAWRLLQEGLLEADGALAERFRGIEADVPAYDENGDEFQICFDGKHLLWFQPMHGMKDWQPVRTAPRRVRLCVPDALHTLLSALVGRRWMRSESATLCTAPAPKACTFTHLRHTTPLRLLQE